VQCAAFTGHHLRDPEFIMEIIDPASGQPLPDGQWGELVLTSLCNEAMPLIRYRSGDITRRLTIPCACGGNLARLDRIKGRIDNIFHTYPISILDEALFHLPNLLDYQAQILPDDGLDLRLDSLSVYQESTIRQALECQGLRPPALKLDHAPLPVFNGPAKRNIKNKY